MRDYNFRDWYWVLQSDGRVYSSKKGTFIIETDVLYKEFCKHDSPTIIKDVVELNGVIATWRQNKYRNEADVLYLEAQETSARTGQPVDLSAWLAKKDQIRAELPYI
jgi:hypothetical protein